MAQFRSPPENVWHQFFNQGIPQIGGIVEGNRKAKALEKREEKEDFLMITKSLFEMAGKTAATNPDSGANLYGNVLDFLEENKNVYGDKLIDGLSVIAQGQIDATNVQKTVKLKKSDYVRRVRSKDPEIRMSPGQAMQEMIKFGWGDTNEYKLIKAYSANPLSFDNPDLYNKIELAKSVTQIVRDPITGQPIPGTFEPGSEAEIEIIKVMDEVLNYLKGEETSGTPEPPPKGGKVIWDQVWDEKTQRPYYINRETKVTSWDVGAGDSVNVVVPIPEKKKEAVAKFNTRESAEGGFIDIEHPMGSGKWISVRERLFQLATGVNAKKSTKERLARTIGITLEELENILK